MKIIYQQGNGQSSLILTTHLPRLVRVADAALNAAPGAVADTRGPVPPAHDHHGPNRRHAVGAGSRHGGEQ